MSCGSSSRKITVEICAASVDDVLAAQRAGADRVELNCAISLGGLTPSAGMLSTALSLAELPIVAMCRPRASGFCYTPHEFRTLRSDIDHCLNAGAHGVAFGVLADDGKIDIARCRELVRACGGREAVFHRALDLTGDLVNSVRQLIDCGIMRVMTSGGRVTALQGCEVLADLAARFRDQITIMAAGGIRPANLPRILATGVCQVHAGPGRWRSDPSHPADGPIRFDGPPPDDPRTFRVVCEDSVRELVALSVR